VTRSWRIEADDEWLDRHSSDSFGRLRRRFGRLGKVGDAVSQAELGPFGGAPRNPRLKIGGRSYSVVRYVEHRIAYTAIQIDLQLCRVCGHRLLEVHEIRTVAEGGARVAVGAVRMCRHCRADSWMFYSRMPTTEQARVTARKVVL
jgi:hypothetical protein